VLLQHGLLNGMEFRFALSVGLREIFDGHQMLAVERGKKLNTGVYRPIADTIVMQFPDHHRTGTAVTFCAAFLGAHQTPVFPQELQHGPRGITVADLFNLVREDKPNSIVHQEYCRCSAATIGAVTEWRKQERYMVMLILVIDAKTYHDPVQEPVLTIFLFSCIEIFAGVENKLIFTCNKTRRFEQWFLTTAIRICGRAGYGIALSLTKKIDTDRGPGAAIGDIQYMCR
jgi:hypothetical protein